MMHRKWARTRRARRRIIEDVRDKTASILSTQFGKIHAAPVDPSVVLVTLTTTEVRKQDRGCVVITFSVPSEMNLRDQIDHLGDLVRDLVAASNVLVNVVRVHPYDWLSK